MYLPELLIIYRKMHKLTQKEVANRLGISRPHYAKIEEGKKIPKFELIDKIARMLGERLIMKFPSDDPFNRALMEDDLPKLLNDFGIPIPFLQEDTDPRPEKKHVLN